jgi:hypothetical protein
LIRLLSLATALAFVVLGTTGCSIFVNTLVGAGVGAVGGLAVAGPPGAAVGAGAGAASAVVVSIITD